MEKFNHLLQNKIQKINFYFNYIVTFFIEINRNDTLFYLINIYKDFPAILIYIDGKVFALSFSFNKDGFLKIIYEENKVIIYISEIESFSYLLFLTLFLIGQKKNIKYYEYDYNLIYNCTYFKNEKKNITKILSKSITDSISIYGFDINRIKNFKKNILDYNLFSLEEIESKKKYDKIKFIEIDELYIKIINGLKFLDTFFIDNIISQLDVESINNIKKKFKELCYNLNENYFQYLNLKKNNFYIKQNLLNNSNCINNIDFSYLLRPRLIKTDKSGLEHISKDVFQNKLIYIIKNDSKYYLNNYYYPNNNNIYDNKVNIQAENNFACEKKENQKMMSIKKRKKSSNIDNSSSFHSLNNYYSIRSFSSIDYKLASINYEGNKNNNELFSFENSKKDNIIPSNYDSIQNYIFRKQSEPYKILEFIKIMGSHEIKENKEKLYNSDIIKEINKGLFVSFGSNIIILYDQYFSIIGQISLDYHINNIYEIDDKFNSKILIFSDTGASVIRLYLYSLKYSIRRLSILRKKYDLCLEINKDNYYFFGLESKCHYINPFNKNNKKKWKVALKCTYKGGIIINEDLILLTSNRVYPNGEDKLIIYNINRKKIIYKITEYSFIFSNNGLSCMNADNINTRIIFCACKKYFSDQKNGILAIYIDIKEEKVKSKLFYETKNFEVYCFCPILKIDNNANILDGIDEINKSENVITKKTDFFFVGGFNKKKKEGLIKLFKVNYELNNNKININFIQDIYIYKEEKNYNNKEEKIEKFLGFKGPITCIIQAKKNGNILVSCWDGNVYLFTPPNIDNFINEEENYDFINSLIDKKNSKRSIKDDENSSFSYFNHNLIESHSIGRKLSEENSSYFNNYNYFNKIDYYLFKENKFDIKQIIQKSSIKIYSRKDKGNIICKYDEINYGDDKCKISYNKLKKFQEFPNYMIYGKKKLYLIFIDFLKFLEYIRINIQNNYKNKFKLEIKLEFQSEKKMKKNKDCKIRCNYYFFVPNNNECKIIFQDDNIFNNDFQGLKFLLKEINNIIYKNLEYEEIQRNENNFFENQSISISSFSIKDNTSSIVPFSDDNLQKISEVSSNSFSNYSDNKVIIKMLPKKSSRKNIIDYINIIGRHQNGANSIYILGNNIIISFGINYEISIYNQIFSKIMEIKIGNLKFNYDVTIFERTNKDIDIIIFHKKKLIIIPINIENKTSYFKIYESHKISFSFYLELCSNWKERNCTGYKLETLFEYIENNLLEYEKKFNYDILSKYQKGIMINKNLFIFTNSVKKTNDNNLIFYNATLKECDNINKAYSFSKYPNGLYLISKEDNKKILLSSCLHKYSKSQENGIMMININLEYNQESRYCCFYTTYDFRVYCFCPLLKTDNNNKDENKIQYFFAGGYDTKKKQGKIKLYKINYNNNNFEYSKIKFLRDLACEDIYLNKKQNMNIGGKNESFKGFNSPITCITQDKLYRYILITCHDGNVYLFSPPNLDHYN